MTKNEIEKRYRRKHPEKIKEKLKRSYQRNKKTRRKQQNDYHRTQYKNDKKFKETVQKRNHNWVRKNKEKVISNYSNGEMKCAVCGIDDFDLLTMDHIYGGGSRFKREYKERTGKNFHLHTFLIKNNFPPGYRVLCWNCQYKERIRLHYNHSRKVPDSIIEKYLIV